MTQLSATTSPEAPGASNGVSKMSHSNVDDLFNLPTPAGDNNERIQELEFELCQAKEHVCTLSLTNASLLLILSNIHRLTTTADNTSPELQAVKELIEMNDTHSTTLPLRTRPLSVHTDNTATPPLTSPNSAMSSNTSVVETGFDGEHAFSRKSPEHASNIQGTSPTMPKHPVQENIAAQSVMVALVNIPDGEERQKTTRPTDDENAEAMHDMFHRFSLEEELEGIADAPAKDRAAMRIVLKEKEDARRKIMRQAAEEKRRIAEREGSQLRNAQSQPAIPRKTYGRQSQEKAKQSNNNDDGLHKTGGKTAMNAHKDTTNLVHSALDGTGADQPSSKQKNAEADGETFGIIDIDATSPKNVNRFGVSFDPSKLDVVTSEKISGVAGSTDTRRTLQIQNIPQEYSMHKLLAHVRGGTIVTTRMIPGMLSLSQGQTALITFKTALEARASASTLPALLAHSEANEDPTLDPEARMQVALLHVATYPTNEVVYLSDPPNSALSGLRTVEEVTRCLEVVDFPKHDIDELCIELLLHRHRFPNKMHAIEEMWFADNTLHIHFTSIKEAMRAHQIISLFHFCKYNAKLHFSPDPCAKQAELADMFIDGDVKLASHGHMGLKSLLETVGLTMYAKKKEAASQKKNKANDLMMSRIVLVPPPTKAVAVPGSPEPTFDGPEGGSGKEGGAGASDASGSRDGGAAQLMTSTPWTDDLMAGLDLL